jgi:PIN domain nuclease of toxin-antitoxin system
MRKLLSDPQNELFLSVASVWEMAIKISLGKLAINGAEELDAFVTRVNVDAGITMLPITISDVSAVATLAWHHRDPFDRLLVVQAKNHGLEIVSADDQLKPYLT